MKKLISTLLLVTLLTVPFAAFAHETVYDGAVVSLIIGTTSSNDAAVRIAEAARMYLGRALHLADLKLLTMSLDEALDYMQHAKPDGLTLLAYHDDVYLRRLFQSGVEDNGLEAYRICGRYAQNAGCGFLARADAPFQTMKELAEQTAADAALTPRVAIDEGTVSHLAFAVYMQWVAEHYGDDVANRFRVTLSSSTAEARQLLWNHELDLFFSDYASQNQYTKNNAKPAQKMKFVGMLGQVRGVSGLPMMCDDGITLGGEPFVFVEDFLFYMPKDTPVAYAEALNDALAELEVTQGYVDGMSKMFYEPEILMSWDAEKTINGKANGLTEQIRKLPPLSRWTKENQ